MLSILRRQSQLLEKELLDLRQAKQAAEAALVPKDEKIKELEEELKNREVARKEEVVLCRACGSGSRSDFVEPDPEPPPEPKPVEAVCSALEELQKKLRAAESQVTMLELEKNLLDLQLITKTSKLRRDLERDLQGAKDAAARAYKESTDAKARARKLDGDLAAKTIEVTALREDLKRRDEQIEFLMQVHDASQSCEWVDTTTANTANDAEMAASLAEAMRLSGAGGPSWQGSPASVARSAARRNANAGSWQCGACTLKNESARTLCEACGTERP